MTTIEHEGQTLEYAEDQPGRAVGSLVSGFGLSYAITVLFSALLVVWKESNESVLSLLKSLTGHHWVTHGVLDIVLFLILGWVLSRTALAENLTVSSLIVVVIGATVLSDLIIAGFFLF